MNYEIGRIFTLEDGSLYFLKQKVDREIMIVSLQSENDLRLGVDFIENISQYSFIPEDVQKSLFLPA